VGSLLVVECGFRQALPVGNISVGLLGGWTSVVGSCGLWFCCMVLSACAVYRLTGDQLWQSCIERGLNIDGPVRSLRRRLSEHVKCDKMDQTEQ
jgi:hypothetical protein